MKAPSLWMLPLLLLAIFTVCFMFADIVGVITN